MGEMSYLRNSCKDPFTDTRHRLEVLEKRVPRKISRPKERGCNRHFEKIIPSSRAMAL
jgi:hypothetical protein